MNGLGRSVNERLAFLAEAGKFECRHIFAGAEENEKRRNR